MQVSYALIFVYLGADHRFQMTIVIEGHGQNVHHLLPIVIDIVVNTGLCPLHILLSNM